MTLKPEHIERSDNLRMVQPHNLATAKAVLEFAESIEKGTAAIDCRGSAVATGLVKPGARVKYRALAGEVYDAVIVFVRSDGSIDIDVLNPQSGGVSIRLTRIVARGLERSHEAESGRETDGPAIARPRSGRRASREGGTLKFETGVTVLLTYGTIRLSDAIFGSPTSWDTPVFVFVAGAALAIITIGRA